jgi:hypothetical protein
VAYAKDGVLLSAVCHTFFLRIIEGFIHLDTTFQPGAQGFLAAYMHTEMRNTTNNLFMHLIKDTNEHSINAGLRLISSNFVLPPLFLVFDPLPPIDEMLARLLGRFACPDEPLAKRLSFGIDGLAHRGYRCIGALLYGLSISSPATSCTYD